MTVLESFVRRKHIVFQYIATTWNPSLLGQKNNLLSLLDGDELPVHKMSYFGNPFPPPPDKNFKFFFGL